MATLSSINWIDAKTLCLNFDADLNASTLPSVNAFSLGIKDNSDTYILSKSNIYNVTASGNALYLTLETDYAKRLQATNTGIYVRYEPFASSRVLKDTNGNAVSVDNDYKAPEALAVSDVYVSRNILSGTSVGLNSVLSDVCSRNICVKDVNKLTLSLDSGVFSLSSTVNASLSNGNKTVTLTGTNAQITSALKNITLNVSQGAATCAATISITAASGGSTYTDALHVYAEDPKSSFFALNGSQYGYVNSLSGLNAASFSSDGRYVNAAVIDAEKHQYGSKPAADSLLCWAGTASNMLTWAGYGALVPANGQEQEDAVFDIFRNNFTDKGGNTSWGLTWFTNGIYDAQTYMSQPKATGGNYAGTQPRALNSGDIYVPQESAFTYVDDLAAALFSGDAAGLGIFTDFQGSNGHAITCWGLSFDAALTRDNPAWLTGLYITDSDDSKNQASAQDILRYVKLQWNASSSTYSLQGYHSSTTYYWLGSFCSLARKDSLKELGQDASQPETPDEPIESLVLTNSTRYVTSGNTVRNTTIRTGGKLYVSSGGQALITTISSGGIQHVAKDGVACSTTISSGGVLYVSKGGVASATILRTGGKQYVYSGGSVADTTISSGGVQYVYGVTKATTIWGTQKVFKGGVANATTISTGGIQYVSKGGVASGTTISSGGVQYVYGVTRATTIWGKQQVFNGGVASTTTISSGGIQYVSSGGVTRATTIFSGGKFYAYKGAVTSGLTVQADGACTVVAGNFLYATNTFTNATITGGSTSSRVQLRGTLIVRTNTNMKGFHVNASNSNISIQGVGNTLGSLVLNKSTCITYNIYNVVAAAPSYMLTLSAKNTQKIGSFFVNLRNNQATGLYKLSQNIVQAKNTTYVIKKEGTRQGVAKLGGQALIKGTTLYRVINQTNVNNVCLQVLNAGGVYKGTARNDVLTGTTSWDVFYGGKGNDTIKGSAGRDVAVYDTTAWGQDVIAKTNGTMTLLFKGLNANNIVKRLSGNTMTITRKGTAQKITVQGWSNATHNIVYASGMTAFNTYVGKAAPTAAQTNNARTEVFKIAGLATT